MQRSTIEIKEALVYGPCRGIRQHAEHRAYDTTRGAAARARSPPPLVLPPLPERQGLLLQPRRPLQMGKRKCAGQRSASDGRPARSSSLAWAQAARTFHPGGQHGIPAASRHFQQVLFCRSPSVLPACQALLEPLWRAMQASTGCYKLRWCLAVPQEACMCCSARARLSALMGLSGLHPPSLRIDTTASKL